MTDDTIKPAGRSRELQRVDRQLRRERDILVISTPRTGLSTFLKQAQKHINAAEHFDGFRVLRLDCQELSGAGEPFANLLYLRLLDYLGLPSVDGSECQDGRLAELFDQLLKTKDQIRLVLIIDNLQTLPQTEIRALLEQIRVVSESRLKNKSLRRVLFILGGQSLDLHKLDPDRTSPFNVAEKIVLEDLSESESVDLISSYLLRSARPYSTSAAKYIHYWTSGHPYLLSEVCSHMVYDVLPATSAARRIDFAVIERVVETMYIDGRDQLLRQVGATVACLSNSTLRRLRNLLNGARYDAKKEAPALRELALLGLISNSKTPVWQIRNPIFDRYLRRQSRLAPVMHQESFMPRRLFVNLEGYKALFQLENDLRDFVLAKMVGKFGDAWWKKVDEKTAKYCQGLKDNESKSGWSCGEDLPVLSYSLFPHLKKIVEDNWAAIFCQYFKPKTIFTGFFDALEGIRNKIAHNRPLTDRDVEQLETFAEQFRNCMYDRF